VIAGRDMRAARLLSGLACLLMLPVSAAASGFEWLPLENYNPFTQVYGVPATEPADVLAPHDESWRLALAIANHADAGDVPTESVTLDGESYYLTVSYRRAVAARFEAGIDIPFISHTGGFLDAPIETWHDIWGMSNSRRSGARNQLSFRYAGEDGSFYALDSASRGLGDVRLTAAMRLGHAGKYRYALRGGIKLPTGESADMLGSGGTDISLALHASGIHSIGGRDLKLNAFAGVVALGDGDILPGIQRDAVFFGGLATGWQFSPRLTLAASLRTQSSCYDSALDEVGGNSAQLAIGGIFHFANTESAVSLAVVEDLADNATTDFAIQVAWVHATGAGGKPK